MIIHLIAFDKTWCGVASGAKVLNRTFANCKDCLNALQNAVDEDPT